jgi:hypothetical protein
MASEFFVCREIDGHPIAQRRADGYIDGTALCKAAGMRWGDYSRRIETHTLLYQISKSTGIPSSSLVERRSGRDGSTFIHPAIAIRFAQDCNARFAAEVSRWVEELRTTGNAAPPSAPSAVPIITGGVAETLTATHAELSPVPSADRLIDGVVDCGRYVEILIETRRIQIDLLRQIDKTWQRVREIASHFQGVES